MFYLLFFVAWFFISMKFGEIMSFKRSLICGFGITAFIFLGVAQAFFG